MKIRARLSFFVLTAALAASGLAPSGPPARAADAGPSGDAPAMVDDAVLLEEDIDIEIASPTSAHVHYLNRTRVLTPRGADEYDTAAVTYEPGVVVKHLRGSVTSPDGKKTDLKKQAIADWAAFQSFVLYAESRARTIRFSAVVPGSILEYEYDLDVHNLVYLPDAWELQKPIPMRRMRLTVRAPASMPLRILAAPGDPRYSRQEDGGFVIHRWTVDDAPPLRREDRMPPDDDVVPWARFSIPEIPMEDARLDEKTWAGVARFQWDLSRDRMDPAPDVAATARSITQGMADPAAKVKALFEFVQGKINYVAVALGLGGWQPHPNGDIFKYRYGDCKDKATLLIAMLRAVGLTGYPVLIRTRDEGLVDPEDPGLHFNHVIAAVPAPEGYQFMDPTSSRTPFTDLPWVDQGVPVLVVKEGGAGDFTRTPLFPPERNRRRRTIDATISSEGDLDGTYVMEAWGQRRVDYDELVNGPPTRKEDLIEDMVALLTPGAIMKDYEVTAPAGPADPVRLRVGFHVPRFVTRAGPLQVIAPQLARVPDLTRMSMYAKRRYPVFFDYLTEDSSEIHLALPPGLTLKRTPAGRDIEGPGLSAKSTFAMTRHGDHNVLTVTRDVKVTRREIPVSDYPALRTFLSALGGEEAGAVTLVSDLQGG